jgi:DNA polymerase-3 subunit alpha
MFTHLHVHSHYSFLTAVGKIDELLDRAKELGQTSLALTDSSNKLGSILLYSGFAIGSGRLLPKW